MPPELLKLVDDPPSGYDLERAVEQLVGRSRGYIYVRHSKSVLTISGRGYKDDGWLIERHTCRLHLLETTYASDGNTSHRERVAGKYVELCTAVGMMRERGDDVASGLLVVAGDGADELVDMVNAIARVCRIAQRDVVKAMTWREFARCVILGRPLA